MSTLTIAQASGLIAAGIVLVKFLLPNVLILSFLATFKEKNGAFTATALTWSVIGKELHSSLWPTLLRSDSTASRGVLPQVNITKWLNLFGNIVVAAAAIVTPLGLYECLTLDKTPVMRTFHLINDTGTFGVGQGTQPRNNSVGWSRLCADFSRPWACPMSATNITLFSNTTGDYFEVNGPYDTTVSQKTVDLFQSGVAALGDSVSGPFDIQWRSLSWGLVQDELEYNLTNANNLSIWSVSQFREVSSLVLDNAYEVVEGLVVDSRNGGVGFRNHSAPPLTPYGSTWEEDLLFIEPVTVCVDTNLTWDYELATTQSQIKKSKSWSAISAVNLRLVDHGGFVNINHTYPEWDRSDTQRNPDLWLRAYKGAWMNNVYAMAIMGVTNLHNISDPASPHAMQFINSTLGKEFAFSYPDGRESDMNSRFSLRSVGVLPYGMYLLDYTTPIMNSSLLNGTALPDPTVEEPSLFANAYNVTDEELSTVSTLCTGSAGMDYANITNFAAQCSLVLGVPKRKDGVEDLMGLPGSSWTTPMYSCISVAQATIKTVTFQFNGSDSLSGLSATDIERKTYENTSSMPIWAVDDTTDPLNAVQALWGIVSRENVNTTNISTVQTESLILPGPSFDGGFLGLGYQNLPAIDLPLDVLGSAYSLSSGDFGMPDYSGSANLAMFRRWQNLTSSVDTTGIMFNLVVTDLLANAAIGTKSLIQPNPTALQKRQNNVASPGQLYVTQYQKTIKYHMPYAVPSIILLALLTAFILLTGGTIATGQTSTGKMKRYLDTTSVGRVMTLRSGTAKDDTGSDGTSSWADTDGKKRVSAGNGTLAEVDTDDEDKKQSSSRSTDNIDHIVGPGPGPEPERETLIGDKRANKQD